MITCALITEVVVARLDVSRDAILGRDRSPQAQRSRMAAWLLCRDLAKKSLPEIGRLMGGRHHTSIMAGLRDGQKLISTDKGFASTMQDLERAVLEAHAAALEYDEVDPATLANDILAGLRQPKLSTGQVVSLAKGVRHYAAEVQRLSAQIARMKKPPEPRSIELTVTDAKGTVWPAVREVIAAQNNLDGSLYTSAEIAARARLERTLKHLKTTVEKLK